MLQIGRVNTLRVTGKQAYGVHLDGGKAGDILLRNKYVPERCQPGDELEVFVYVDRENHIQATTQTPYATVGQFACLQVVANTSSGAYLDWGLDNDLFVPKSEQQDNMKEGESYVVFVFLSERTNRITASSKLAKFLSPRVPKYKEGEEVDLLIYEKTAMGYGALVNRSHVGMIYQNEVFQKLSIGQQLRGYIRKIREDRKIDLSLQQSGYQRVDEISQAILNTIKEKGGRVAVTDKSSPDEIYALFGVSKKVFKKAIGALYKKRLVVLDTNGIKLA
ncbi:MAG: GntR family transcriptional regulator [Desulfocapsa sp.]|nr:GntR family transcriptional regulator [Desulfocapsa sp.]